MKFLSKLFGQKSMADSTGYIELRDRAMTHLEALTTAHRNTWKFGDEDRWDFDQEQGELIFTFADGTQAACSAQIIGTFNTQDDSWLIASANGSIAPSLTKDAQDLQRHGNEAGFARLSNDTWKGSVDDAWGLTAISAMLQERQGAYRGPAGSTFVFFTFDTVRLMKPE